LCREETPQRETEREGGGIVPSAVLGFDVHMPITRSCGTRRFFVERRSRFFDSSSSSSSSRTRIPYGYEAAKMWWSMTSIFATPSFDFDQKLCQHIHPRQRKQKLKSRRIYQLQQQQQVT